MSSENLVRYAVGERTWRALQMLAKRRDQRVGDVARNLLAEALERLGMLDDGSHQEPPGATSGSAMLPIEGSVGASRSQTEQQGATGSHAVSLTTGATRSHQEPPAAPVGTSLLPRATGSAPLPPAPPSPAHKRERESLSLSWVPALAEQVLAAYPEHRRGADEVRGGLADLATRRLLRPDAEPPAVADSLTASEFLAQVRLWAGCREWTKEHGEWAGGFTKWIASGKYRSRPRSAPASLDGLDRQGEAPAIDVASRLEQLAAAVPEDCEEVAIRIRRLDPDSDLDELSAELARLDGELIALAESRLDPEALDAEIEPILRTHRKRLSPAVAEETRLSLRVQVVRKLARIPVIALSSPDAEPRP